MSEIMEVSTLQNILLTNYQTGGLTIVQSFTQNLQENILKAQESLLEKFLQIHLFAPI